MPTWNSVQYLRFAHERTQPAVDLAARIDVSAPKRIIDLGCGPGNSTAVIARRWPGADVTGLDNSLSMLQSARQEQRRLRWIESDITTWAAAAADDNAQRFDVVFSNAALQWVGNHQTLFPQIFDAVLSDGVLAFQIPSTLDLPHQRLIRDVADSAKWRTRFESVPGTWHVETPEFYYDLLAPKAHRVDLWLTDYVHVLESPHAVVEWYRGTGLRPFLDALPDDATRTQFLADYEAAITPYFPRRSDGRVLMYFRRLFVIAYR